MTCRYIRHSLIKFGLDSWAYINNVSSSSWASRDEICSCKHATDLLSPRSSVHHLKRCHSASTNAFLRDNQADVHDVGIYSFWIRLLEGRPLYFNCWISCFICRHTHTSNVRSELLLNDPPPVKLHQRLGAIGWTFKNSLGCGNHPHLTGSLLEFRLIVEIRNDGVIQRRRGSNISV